MLSCLYAVLVSSVFVWPILVPGLHGGEEAVWIRSYLFVQFLKLLNILMELSSSLLFYNLHFCHQIVYTVILFFDLILYTWHLLNVCLSVLGEGSLLCCSWFLPFFSVLKRVFSGEFFLIRVDDLRTEGVVSYTDCKAPWGKCYLWYWAI